MIFPFPYKNIYISKYSLIRLDRYAGLPHARRLVMKALRKAYVKSD